MIPNNVYLASRYSLKDEMKAHAEELGDYGINVTSRWLAEPHALNTKLSDITPELSREYALLDLEDIINSDTIIFFSEDPNNQPPRGGRHFEAGVAFANGLRMVAIGPKENIFHFLPQFTHYNSFAEFVTAELSS